MSDRSATTRTVVTHDGVPLRFTIHEGGSGTPLVLIAGTGYAGATWPADVIDALRGRRPVVTFDHRGTGRSASSDGAYTTRGFADDTATIIEALGRGPVHVLGHSMGGRIAQWLALDRPELVASLILASSGSGRAADGTVPVHGVPYHTALGLARDGYLAHLRNQIETTFFTPAFATREPDRVAWLVDAFWRSRPNLADYLKHVVARQGHDATDALGRIGARTLVVVGERDTHGGGTGSHRAQSEALATAIPGASLEVVEGLAHGLFWQTPERTVAVIQRWLPS